MEVRRLDPAFGLSNLLQNLDKRVGQVETRPQGSTVIQPGNTIIITDPNSGIQTILGTLPDGSTGLQQFVNDTTPPPQPSTPALSSSLGLVTIAWNGLNYLGGGQPKDYDRTVVQVSSDGFSNWTDAAEMRGNDVVHYSGAKGGDTVYFQLVSYDLNQNASVPSAVQSIVVVGVADDAVITSKINSATQAATSAQATADGKNTVYYSNVQPTGGTYKTGDLWFNTADSYKLYTYSGTAWVLAQDSASAQSAAASAQSSANAAQIAANAAQATANAAQSAASAAQLAANNAQATATSAQSLASSANNAATAAQSTATSAQSLASSANNAATAAQVSANSAQSTANYAQSLAASAQAAATAAQSTATSAQSLASSANTAATAAQASANTAQTTANSKNASYYLPSAPTGGSYKTGDLWFNTSANYQLSTYNGTTWVLAQDSYTALTTSQAASAYAGTKGKVWFQSTAPAGGTSCGWTGATDASTSTMYRDSNLLYTNLLTNPSFEAASGTVDVRTNLAAYPDFELASGTVNVRTNIALDPAATSTTNWTNVGGATYTKTVDTGTFHSGTSSIKFSISGSGQLGTKCAVYNPGFATNDTVKWSVWVYPSATMSIQPYWERATPTYTGGNGGSFVTCPANQWTQLTGTLTLSSAQADATGSFGFGFYSQTAWNAGDFFYADEIVVERNVGALSNYYDGTTLPSTRVNLATNPNFQTNITGYALNVGTGGAAALSQGTDGGYSGTNYLRATWTTGNSAPGYIELNRGVVPVVTGLAYSFGAYVRSSVDTSFKAQIGWADSSGTRLSTSASSVITVPANTWTLVLLENAVAPASAVGAWWDWCPQTNQATGQTLDIDNVMVVQGATLGVIFDGSSTATSTRGYAWYGAANASRSYEYDLDYTAAWSGTANASISYVRGAAVSGWATRWYGGNGGNGATYQTKSGLTGNALRKLWTSSTTAAANDSGINPTTDMAVSPNTSYTASIYMRPSITTAITCYIQWYDSTGTFISNTSTSASTSCPANVWTRGSVTATAPANAATARFIFGPYIGSAATMPAGAYLDFDQCLIEQTNVLLPYFCGSTAASGDYTYVWLGGANASSSVQRGTAVAAISSANNGANSAGLVQSTDWNNSRGHSLRIVNLGTSNNTAATLTGSGSNGTGALVPGQTYTISATFRQTAPQTSALYTYPRAITYNDSVIGWGGTQWVQAPNVAGSTRLTLTFTVAASATWATVRLYNGATMGNGDVWWDDVVLVQGSVDPGYFDGNSPSDRMYDLWVNTAAGNKAYSWDANSHSWLSAQDTAIAAAANSASSAMSVAQGKNVTFISAAAPTASAVGDLWLDSSNGYRLNRWSGSAWVNVQDSAIATAQSSANNALSVANGKNTTFIAASAPTASATGDIWLDSSNGYRMNRWSGSAWVNVQDAAIAAAQSAANTAQTSANGKNTVTYSTSAASGSGTTVGDTWFQTDGSGNVLAMWNWSGSAWVSQAIGNQVIAALDAGKITTGYLNAARIQAGTITASMIATDTITASQIAAGAITASELAAGAVTASAIAANTITASALAANAVTATAIAADTITAAQIAAGAITASELAAGAVTASAIAAGSVNANAIAAGSITATALAANSITASAIAAGTITASAMAAGSVTAQQLAGGSVTASALAANAVTATAISAKTITTDKLMVFDSTNLVADGDFEQMAQTTWTYNSYASLDTTGTNSYTGSNSLKFTNTGATYGNCNNNIIIPVEPNAWYYWEYWYKTTAGAVPTYGVRIASAGGASASMVVDTLPNTAQTTWAKRSGQFQIPSTVYAASARFDVQSGTTSDSVWIDAFKLRRQNGAELIVDGSIAATELAAGAVTAAKIAANSVTATALAANSITATALAAQSITATALAAQSITASALAAQSITATALAAQSITATAIAAKAITTDKLLVADTDDYVVDPYFYDSTLNGSGTTYLSSNAAVPTAGLPTVPSVLSVPAGYDFFVGDWFDLQPGDKFYVEGWVTNPTGTSNIGFGLWYANTRQYGGNSNGQARLVATAAGSSASWVKYSGEVTIPSLGSGSGSAAQPPQFGRVWVGPGNAAGWWITGFHVRRKNAAQLIVDGGITANMLSAQSITATALAAQSITATALAAQSITATALAALSVTATALAAQSITATALAAGSITASAIAASAVDATKLAAQSITATALKANSITASALAAQSITATALAANSITASALAANSITATAIAASAITASAIAAGTITATNGIVASLDAGVISAGTLNAARIGAKTITSDKLVIGSMENMISEPTFAAGGVAWAVGGQYSIDATGSRGGSTAWKIACNGTKLGAYNLPNDLVVSDSQSYRFNTWLKSDVAIPATGVNLYIKTKSTSGVYTENLVASTPAVASGTWYQLSGVFTMPANTVAASFGVFTGTNMASGNVWIDSVFATRMSNGELIVDGSITANSLAASAITAGKISAGAIDGFTINGATINGGVISTTTVAGSAVARMGPSTVKDAINGTNNYYPGNGFGVVGGSTVMAGMYSTDGDSVTVTGGNGGVSGMNYHDFTSNGQTIYSYSGMSIASRSSITIGAGQQGANGAQLHLAGPQVYISNSTPYNSTSGIGGVLLSDDTWVYAPGTSSYNKLTGGVARYVEFVTPGNSNPPANTTWGPGIYSVGTSMTQINDFATVSGANDCINLNVAGVYMFSLYMTGGTVLPTGELQLKTGPINATSATGWIAATDVGGTNTWNGILSSLAYISGPTRIFTQCVLTSSWINMGMTLRIFKLA